MSDRDFVRALPRWSSLRGRRLYRIHLDPLLLGALLVIMAFGLVVL